MQLDSTKHGEKHFQFRAVCRYSKRFRAFKNANIMRVVRFWCDRENYGDHDGSARSHGVGTSVIRAQGRNVNVFMSDSSLGVDLKGHSE